jgi:hypothetical protein
MNHFSFDGSPFCRSSPFKMAPPPGVIFDVAESFGGVRVSTRPLLA